MSRRWFAAVGLLLVVGLGRNDSATAQAPDHPDDTLLISFLDVHQGDAILVRLGGHSVLIDAGRGDDIVLVLEEEGVDSLVAAIVSHNHDDHIGGMDAVLADYPVALYLSNGRPAMTGNGAKVEAIIAERGIPHPSPPWAPIILGDVRITVRSSPLPDSQASENNSSLAVLIERGRFKALLTGDSQKEELSAWLETSKVPDVDVLKAAHHGSYNGVIPGWLHATKPEVVVISVGANNAYGHPHPWALRYYALAKRRIFRTDRDGTVVVSVDAEGRYSVIPMGAITR